MTLRALLREVVRVEIRNIARDTVREMKPVARPSVETRDRTPAYKGDSHAKKSARLRVWELVLKTIGTKAFRKGLHLFLASREGGDASTLRGLGVPDQAMLAVDLDAKALSEFRRHYPDVPCRHQDVGDVLDEYHRKLESVWLDFSSQVTENTLKRVGRAVQAIRPGGVLACTFAIGREKWWYGAREDDTPGTSEDRLNVLQGFLADQLPYSPRVLARFEYQSESIRGPGALMAVMVVQMQAGRDAKNSRLQALDYHDLQRDALRYVGDPNLCWLLNLTEDKAEKLRARVREYPPPP
jgi:hypothetical protein